MFDVDAITQNKSRNDLIREMLLKADDSIPIHNGLSKSERRRTQINVINSIVNDVKNG